MNITQIFISLRQCHRSQLQRNNRNRDVGGKMRERERVNSERNSSVIC